MEFENLQIEVPTHDDPSQSQLFGIKIYEKKYHNNSKDFVVGFNPNSKEFIERKERRAKRFGVQKNADAVDEDETESDTASFTEIDLDHIKWPPVTDEAKAEIRHDAILVYGVNEMSTKDVFEYFSLYGPDTLEWIDDCSCNVVWDDKKFVMQAMDNMSRTFTMLSRIKHSKSGNPVEGNPFLGPPVTIKDEEDDDTEDSDSNAIVIEDEEINPKDIWRVAVPYKGNKTRKNVKEIKPVQLFFRPATIKDKKLPGAAQRSEYYLKYGKNPNGITPEVDGIISKSRKRKLEKLKKTAEERFKTDEPDVKLVDVGSVKSEGTEQKMEIDGDEPEVKRLNLHRDGPNQMTMIADKVELRQKLGSRYSPSRVQDRLGEPLLRSDGEGSSEDEGSIRTGVFKRISGGVHDRLGTKNQTRTKNQNATSDARNEIELYRKKHHRKNLSEHGYEDEHGIYHDIYRADDDDDLDSHKKKRDHDRHKIGDSDNEVDSKDNVARHLDQNKRHEKHRKSINISRKDLRDRVNSRNRDTESPTGVGDLRHKLRRKKLKSKVKEELPDTGQERLNLCIEIKQEVSDVEMNDDSDGFTDATFEF